MRTFDNTESVFTAQMYGEKYTIEKPYSDLDIYELMDVFKSLALSLGFQEGSWNNYIINESNNINENID